MSKIAEQKALEEYPPCINSNGFDLAESRREGYIRGYDQDMKDVLEKACEWLKENSKNYVIFDEVGYRGYAHNLLIKEFKNYMQNEIQD